MSARYASILATILALAGGIFVLRPHVARAPQMQGAAVATMPTSTPPAAIPAAPHATATAHSPTPSVAPVAAATASSTENAILLVDGTRYPFAVTAGMTLADAMRSLATTAGLRFTSSDYPGLGIFIESIGGRANSDGYYWFLYVNGTSASRGASQTPVHPGDSFEWRFEQGH